MRRNVARFFAPKDKVGKSAGHENAGRAEEYHASRLMRVKQVFLDAVETHEARLKLSLTRDRRRLSPALAWISTDPY